MTTAYEQALHAIGIVDRGDPLAELLARKIIEVAQTGIREPADISAQAIKEIGIPTYKPSCRANLVDRHQEALLLGHVPSDLDRLHDTCEGREAAAQVQAGNADSLSCPPRVIAAANRTCVVLAQIDLRHQPRDPSTSRTHWHHRAAEPPEI
ncbi:hypothetical protein [Bradyrhizobium algeriense]|uniref:hypothetical protein n=1 Tax=Bradyrhizobium algeriense TaxID=634784 RepID=UPI00167EAB74|nr:hypothetical protein [Bradyrhizobium algeriense]